MREHHYTTTDPESEPKAEHVTLTTDEDGVHVRVNGRYVFALLNGGKFCRYEGVPDAYGLQVDERGRVMETEEIPVSRMGKRGERKS